MFSNIYEVLKDFIAWLYEWAEDAATTLIGQIWLSIPEFMTTPVAQFMEYANIANHWFPVQEGFALGSAVLTFRVTLGAIRLIWRFTPIIGA